MIVTVNQVSVHVHGPERCICRKIAGEAGNRLARVWVRPLPVTGQRLPVELRADLADARIARIADDSEVRIGDVAARVLELRVVEDVEEFTPNLERLRFRDRDYLLNT